MNFFTAAYRALGRDKTLTVINLIGLVIGFTSCVLLVLLVRHELSYDQWLPNAERVFQLQTWSTDASSSEYQHTQLAAIPAARALERDFPEIEKVSIARNSSTVVLRNGEASDGAILLVDPTFFEILQLPFAQGRAADALREINALVLTESEAVRRFGRADVLGRTLTLIQNGRAQDMRISGVLRDLPQNTHLHIEMIGRFNPANFANDRATLESWGRLSAYVYARLRPGADLEAMRARMPAWEARNIPVDMEGGHRTSAGDTRDWRLVNVQAIHMGEAQAGGMTPGGDLRTIYTFGIVAAMILAMASFNFINLATAGAARRAREIGLRKVLGARRLQLIAQFMGESILFATLAMLIALALVELLLPRFSAFIGSDLSVHYLGLDGLLWPAAAMVLLVGGAAGIYPAFYLSHFAPATVLRSSGPSPEMSGSGIIRNALVVTQFAVSIGLTICTIIVYAQTAYMQTSDAGYRRDGLIQVGRMSNPDVAPAAKSFTHEVQRLDGVTAASLTSLGVASGYVSTTTARVFGQADSVPLGLYSIDPQYLPTMHIRLLAGRNFSEGMARDNATIVRDDPEAQLALARRGLNIMVTELGARRLGFASARQALGRQIGLLHFAGQDGYVPATIVGVTDDARLRSAHDELEPLIYYWNDNEMNRLLIRYQGDPVAVRGRIERLWKRFAPNVPFRADFAEDLVHDLYDAEEGRGMAFAAFSFLAISVACLGLFGLAAFTARRRTREIGIRKVFGARTRDIVRLLAWQFSKPVIVANLIAWPAAWWVMREWLNRFDTRIDLGPGPFVLASLLALVIAIGTIAGHAFKVARANPILALRYE